MDPHTHLLLLLHLLFFTALRGLSAASASDDIRSLLEFKKGIHTDPFRVVDSWMPPTAGSAACPRDWHGISCDDSGAVVSLALDGLGLAGDLKFTTLIGLKSLRNLTLSGNAFTGRLVPTIGTMASLQHLDLSGNQFYGPVPRRITELSRLIHLNLSRNHFTQGFPTGIWKLQQLRVLDLRSNNFWGDIVVLLSELWNAEYIDLSDNAFYGGIRMDSGNLSSLGNTLRYLNLSNNKLNGGFFSSNSLRVFKSLDVLDLGYNQLNGELPTFDSLYNLKVFRAASNQLYGYIPEALFGSTMQLMELDLSGNGFTGQYPNEASQFANLISIKIRNNSLVGPILPILFRSLTLTKIGNMQRLKLLDLGNNTLSGELPRTVPQNLQRFPSTSFHPGNALLVFSDALPAGDNNTGFSGSRSHCLKSGIQVAFIVGTIAARSMSAQKELLTEAVEYGYSDSKGVSESRKLDVLEDYRLAGELFLLDNSLMFTAEELSHAPAEVLGRGSHDYVDGDNLALYLYGNLSLYVFAIRNVLLVHQN
ncbi:putative inactive receptor kinase [Cocos nucifera]|uniref:Putative inactive receptor kinase n=1 Tax=Cocos nucifera TaxID=13894 RepID=A0A8K0MWW0_COCNU|nr:putative inactive receptor kinase [Cocos nucifera]